MWGSKGRVLETQGFPELSFGDPLKQVRPELALGLSAYQVLAPDPSVLGEHMTSWLSLGSE